MAVNSIQMPINIKLNQNEAMSSSFGRYYLEAATSEVLSTEGLVNHITTTTVPSAPRLSQPSSRSWVSVSPNSWHRASP